MNLMRGMLLFSCAVMATAGASYGQDVEVVLARSGTKPKVLNLRKGETTRLMLKSADGEHCFTVDALRVEKRVIPDAVTILDLTPDRAGSFPFYCCLEPEAEGLRGRVVVSE
jgi:cytochrome c oxidase subunit II